VFSALLKFYSKWICRVAREEGQDLVEYALVVALLAFSATSGTKALGSGLKNAFNNISTTLSSSLS